MSDLLIYAGLAATAATSALTVTLLVRAGKDGGDAIGVGLLVLIWPISGLALVLSSPAWLPVLLISQARKRDARKRGALK